MSIYKSFIIVSLLSSIFSIISCNYITGGSDNSEPPIGLSSITSEKSFTKLWGSKTGVGSNGQYLKLKPLLLTKNIITVDSNGLVQSRNINDGLLAWQDKLEIKVTQGVSGNENSIFIGTADGSLLALSSKDGKRIWQRNLAKNILNNPYFDGKNLYIQTTDGTLSAFSGKDGSLIWEYKMLVPDLTLYSTSSPLVWQNSVIAGFSNGKIVSFDKKSGMPMWDYQVAVPSGDSSIQRMVDVSADPMIVDGFLYAVSYQGRVVALDLVTGNEQWQQELSSINNMSASSKYLYVSDSDGTVWSLNRSNGRVLWKQNNLHMRDLSGTSFVDNTVLVADYQGYIHGLANEHGDFIARTKLSNTGIRVAPLVKNGIIYILDNSGNLAAYKLDKLDA